jgi:uncharacterized protein (DUF1778 family)
MGAVLNGGYWCKMVSGGGISRRFASSPMVITGSTKFWSTTILIANKQPIQTDRSRVSIDLSPQVSLLLDHVCDITGSNKSQIVLGALMDALPSLLERAEALGKRASTLQQQKRK